MVNIVVINGNPARDRVSFSEVLCQAYGEAASLQGHCVRHLKISALDFDPILHEGLHGSQDLEPGLVEAQGLMSWARHVVIVYPMWQFGVPALVKGFFERSFVPGFAYALSGNRPLGLPLLQGRSARLIQTQTLDDDIRSRRLTRHGPQALTSLFRFCGFAPVKCTELGSIEASLAIRLAHIRQVEDLARQGQ